MPVASGRYAIGPDNATLNVDTYAGGIGSRLGHDLVLEATRWGGTVDVDAQEPAASSVRVTVDARSLQVVRATGGIRPLTEKDKGEIAQNQARALQSGRFPDITFESTAVTGAPPRLSIQGNLTIKGVTRPVTVDLEYAGTATDPFGNQRVGLEGQATINRKDWGISWNAALEAGGVLVSEKVTLEFEVSAIRTADAA